MKYAAILFDCDGVLVDSEPLVNQVLIEMLGEMGWSLSLDQSMQIFTGKMVRDQAELIHQHTGIQIDPAWELAFRARRDQRLQAELQAIPGARAAVSAIHHALAGRMAVASGADIGKVRMQLHKTGMDGYFDGHIYSGQDLGSNKPAPDIYLHAAQQLGVDPTQCAIIEDSVTGVRAGVAAGATVYGYVPPDSRHSSAQALLQAGAHQIFHHMESLPQRLQSAI